MDKVRKRKSASEMYNQQRSEVASVPPAVRPPEPLNLEDMDMEVAAGEPAFLAKAVAPAAPLLERSTMQNVSSEELQLDKGPIRVKETGFWRFKKIIVPPNVHVVHTRLGKKEPVTLGLGQSFRFNPNTDSYMVVPAAIQTIGVFAHCNTREKQGIDVLAYVQWKIEDFSVAYKKLDFSNNSDPLGIVNAQLCEQAEAAIKDKISTMEVEEVLKDKADIIEELTSRLKAVTEGRNDGDAQEEGLGIKIITVQLREANVSSPELWANLQAEFRVEKEKQARLQQMQMERDMIAQRAESEKEARLAQVKNELEVNRATQLKDTEMQTLQLQEENKRRQQEAEAEQARLKLQESAEQAQRESEQRLRVEAERRAHELELAAQRRQFEADAAQRLQQLEAAKQKASENAARQLFELEQEQRLELARVESELAALAEQEKLAEQTAAMEARLAEVKAKQLETELAAELARETEKQRAQAEWQKLQNEVEFQRQQHQAQLEGERQKALNGISQNHVLVKLIEQLPKVAEHSPKAEELKVFQFGADAGDTLGLLTKKAMGLLEGLQAHKVPETN